ncbi:MAG: hypothetical protein E7014_06450 [Alphaproteobacteria bacterium]|nr:hypothetical protein [Alphaproteobacteria bacterium]
MQNAGYSTTDFTVTDETITYNKDMTVSTALDISKCNLIVNGTLTVNSGITLKAKNVSATSSTANGIDNSGTITATQTVYGKGYSYGIDNKSSGTINANKLDAGQTRAAINHMNENAVYYHAINNNGIIDVDLLHCSDDLGTNNSTSIKTFNTINADEVYGRGVFSLEAGISTINNANVRYIYVWTDAVLTVTDTVRAYSIVLTKGEFIAKNIYVNLFLGSSGSYLTVQNMICSGSLNSCGILNADFVYAKIIEQELWIDIMGPTKLDGPGKMTAPKIYYCTSYKYGTYSTTPIKKCAETCSGSTPIWNGESCEACPSIRPNWNAEYGICE